MRVLAPLLVLLALTACKEKPKVSQAAATETGLSVTAASDGRLPAWTRSAAEERARATLAAFLALGKPLKEFSIAGAAVARTHATEDGRVFVELTTSASRR